MKTFIFIIALALGPLLGNAQVYKFKVFRTKIAVWDGSIYKITETNDVDFLAVINLDKEKVQTYGKEYTDYDIVKLKTKEVDEDGGTYATFDAVDKKGSVCVLGLSIYGTKLRVKNEETGCIASLGLTYGDTLVMFYLKKND